MTGRSGEPAGGRRVPLTWLLLSLAATASAAAPAGGAGEPSAPPAAAPPRAVPTPEEALWRRTLALQVEAATTQPLGEWFAATLRQRQALLDGIRLYQTLYPGGAYRTEAVRLELATLYELCVLKGGTLGPLRQRVQEYLRGGGADDPAVWEAAYWDIICRRAVPPAATTLPATAPGLPPDEPLLSAYREYLERYPRSPYVPRLAVLLFEAAQRAGDAPQMQRLVELLERHFAEHAATATLAAQWRREQAVGRPFWITFDRPPEPRVDTRELVGRPVLVLVWSAADADGRRLAQRVEQFRQRHPRLGVVGVNVDMRRAVMTAAVAELGLPWPQFHDGLGLANRFAREWGVRRTPAVFVIDAAGRLAGFCEDDRWERLAAEALRETGP